MNTSRLVPTAVIGLAATLGVAGLIVLATGDPPDYADLVPAPDSIVWNEGQETTFFVSTNREDVDMRINSVALGIANVQGAVPHSGVLMVLGASVGCQDWAVSKLSATVTDTGYDLEIEVDRDNFTGTASVSIRLREEGDSDWIPYGPILVSGNEATQSVNSTIAKLEVEASSVSSFPTALTRFITIDRDAGAATVDEEAETLLMLPNTGVGLKGCSDHEDVRVTLHGAEGAELNRYEFDIGAAATATPRPDAGYASRRVCVDNQAQRAVFLSGGESVGADFDSSDFGLSGNIDRAVISDVEAGNDFRYFFESEIVSGNASLTVSEAGAGATLGLIMDRIYPVRVTATDASGASAFLDVGVWLDIPVSPGGDGLCPVAP